MNTNVNATDGISIDRITNGYVLDHIKAGYGMRIYKHLKLDTLDNSVALIQNVKSVKNKRKDIIKIQGLIDIDMNVLGYIDPGITVITVKDDNIKSKRKLQLPDTLTNVITCRNPRCITSIEAGLSHEFKLSDAGKKVYRCVYCEQESK